MHTFDKPKPFGHDTFGFVLDEHSSAVEGHTRISIPGEVKEACRGEDI